MPSFRSGRVVEIVFEREGLQRVLVDLEADPEVPDDQVPAGDGPAKAYVLTGLIGDVAVGDEVVCNTTAVEWGLGTGGWHVVHWNLTRRSWRRKGPGHIMKLRYTSLQADTGSAEEHLDDLPTELDGLPVVVCSVHSQVPCVAVALKAADPTARLVYVMTDGASLPLVFSDLVANLREQGLLDATVTAGHAFGGDLEAVTIPSALALARHQLHADVVVVSMGPGVVGTDTTLGTTAVEVATILDTAAALGGRPVMCLRVSEGDHRERHRGVSHHSRTVLDLVHAPVTVAAHPLLGARGRVDAVEVDEPDTPALLAARGLRVTTMGRGPDEDRAFFQAAGAAGTLAAQLLR